MGMTVWVLLPVKPFPSAKMRLSSVLSEEQRQNLARELWIRTLKAITGSGFRSTTLVISRELEVLEQAQNAGLRVFLEPEGLDLNGILTGAAAEAARLGADSILVLPMDLPLLSKESLDSLQNLLPVQSPALMLVPDRHGRGTNILFQTPPQFLPFQFGPSSFAHHRAAAKRAGVEPVIIKDLTLAMDLDLPADLFFLSEQMKKTKRSPQDDAW
jgi:2-phospho-L-lactate/phosphoenolpyruvate guanylyltransferase